MNLISNGEINMDENSFMWKIRHLWWILISFIFLVNGLGLIYAGFQADERLWKIEGTIYELIVAIFITAVGIPLTSNLTSFITGLYLLSWIMSIIRSFIIRNQYLEKIRHNKYQNSRYYHESREDDYILKANTSRTVNQTISKNLKNYQGCENLAGVENNQNQSLTSQEANTIKPVNINNASAECISQLPGLDITHANKIISLRQSGKTIRSLDELKILLELDDNQIEQLKEYVITTSYNYNQRKLDL